MPDRQKVIRGLEYCITHYNCRNLRTKDCPYLDLCKPILNATGNTLMRDALAMLKEQDDDIRNLTNDLEEVRKEHQQLLDKKIPLITDGQEVVRCKDCKFMYEDDVFQCGIKAGYFPVHEDWFCADGERKE